MTALYDWLFQRVLRLDMAATSPPWRLSVFNDGTNAWEGVGQPSYAPLCTGDTIPAMIGTGDGQSVLVPMT